MQKNKILLLPKKNLRKNRQILNPFLLLLLFCFNLISCATVLEYTPTATLLPRHIDTVAIPMFDNQTRYRGFEFDLTRAVVREIQNKTTLKIRELKDSESILTAQILRFRQPVISEDTFDRIREVQVRLTVQFQWLERHTSRVLAESIITESAEFVSLRGENLETSTEEAFSRVAERMVNLMEASKF